MTLLHLNYLVIWRRNIVTSGEKIIKMVETRYKKPARNRLLQQLLAEKQSKNRTRTFTRTAARVLANHSKI